MKIFIHRVENFENKDNQKEKNMQPQSLMF